MQIDKSNKKINNNNTKWGNKAERVQGINISAQTSI